MKTTSKKLENNKVEVTVKYTADEVSDAVVKKYKDFSKKYKFPGFRPGHAPRPVIDSAMGGSEAVLASVTDEIVNYSCPRAIDGELLNPAGQPDFGKGEIKTVEEGKPYSYTFKIDVAPEFKLSSYEPVKIEMPSSDVSKKEVDDQVKAFTQNYFSYEDADSKTPAKGDASVVLKISGKDDDGKEIKSLTKDSMNYHLTSKFLPADFEKEITGMKAGDKKSFSIKVPDEPTVYTTSLKGKTKNIAFDVEVKKVQTKVLPKVTDEWVEKNMGFKTVSELREQIEAQIKGEKERMEPILKENKCLEQLIKRLKDDVPKELADKKEAELLTDFFQQLQQQGMTFDQYLAQYQLDQKKFKQDLKKQAKDVVAQDLCLDALAANKGIKVTETEIKDEFKKGDPDKWEELYAQWQDRGDIHIVRQAILRMKAARELVESAVVTDEKPAAKKDSAKKPAAKTSAKKSTK